MVLWSCGSRPRIRPCHGVVVSWWHVPGSAGIRVIVITGDNKLTAEAVCRKIGVFGDQDADLSRRSFTGGEFAAMAEPQQIHTLMSDPTAGLVFSRAMPAHKQDLVRLLQKQGLVVAMTGDGVNDAPALKKVALSRISLSPVLPPSLPL